MNLHLLRTLVIAISASAANAASIYVSLKGSDTASGSLTAPLKSIQTAINKAVAGDKIFVRAGTYALTATIMIFKKSGTQREMIEFGAFNGEKVILDGEGLPFTPGTAQEVIPNTKRGCLHVEQSEYWRIHDIEVMNGPYGIYVRDASNNIYENLISHDNYETGFHMTGALANNSILNLDSYMNRDPRNNGEGADGLGIKQGKGSGNVIIGARLWNNSDDGLDFWEFKSGITIKNSISWGNGINRWSFSTYVGDGNGFKLGGGEAGQIVPVPHTVINSFAFSNAHTGFTDNSQTGAFVLTRNTAWKNGVVGFKFSVSGNTATLKDNVSIGNTAHPMTLSSAVSGKASGNTWNRAGTWDDTSFVTTDNSKATGKRADDGSIIPSDFLVLKTVPTIGANMNTF